LSLPDALTQGKEGKPVLILFMDTGAKSKLWSELLGDKSLDEVFGKVAYVALEYKKDSEDAKKWKVSAAPTLVLIDATKDEAKEIKKLTSPNPPTVKKELEAAIKKLVKK